MMLLRVIAKISARLIGDDFVRIKVSVVDNGPHFYTLLFESAQREDSVIDGAELSGDYHCDREMMITDIVYSEHLLGEGSHETAGALYQDIVIFLSQAPCGLGGDFEIYSNIIETRGEMRRCGVRENNGVAGMVYVTRLHRDAHDAAVSLYIFTPFVTAGLNEFLRDDFTPRFIKLAGEPSGGVSFAYVCADTCYENYLRS